MSEPQPSDPYLQEQHDRNMSPDQGTGKWTKGEAEDVHCNTSAAMAELNSAPTRPHKAFNPTTKKLPCPHHKDVIVCRHKLRTGVTTIPCWRCMGEAALRAEERETTAEIRAQYLHTALQSEKGRTAMLERRATLLEEEHVGLRDQIARLIEQVAALSEEVNRVNGMNRRLMTQSRPNKSTLPPKDSLKSGHSVHMALSEVSAPDLASPSTAPTTATSATAPTTATSATAPTTATSATAPIADPGRMTTNPPEQARSTCTSSTPLSGSPVKDVTLSAPGGEAGPPLSLSCRPLHPRNQEPSHVSPAWSTSPPTPSESVAARPLPATPTASASRALSATGGSQGAAWRARAATDPGVAPIPVATGPHKTTSMTAGTHSQAPTESAARGGSGSMPPSRPYLPAWLQGKRQAEAGPRAQGGEQNERQKSRTPQEGGRPKDGKKKRVWTLFKRGKRASSIPAAAAAASGGVRAPTTMDELDEALPVDRMATRMLRLLESRPEALEKIYRKSEQLEEWRMEVLLELGVGEGTGGREDGGSLQEGKEEEEKKAGGEGRTSPVQGLDHSASRIFLDEIALVEALTDRIKQCVLRHVADAFALARASPSLLHQAVNVVRLHAAFGKKKLETAQAKIARTGSKDLYRVLRLCGIEDWDGDVRLALKEAASVRALEVFTVAHLEAAAAMEEGGQTSVMGVSREKAMIGAAESLLEDMREMLVLVPPFFAPAHRAVSTILEEYDTHLMRQVAALHGHGLSDLEIGDLFEVNRFLLRYRRDIVVLGASAPNASLQLAVQACLQECLVKTRHQTSVWFTAILGRQGEVLYDAQGRPFTAKPEDLFQIIHTQVRVAIDAGGFTGDDLCALLLVILNALKEFVAEHHNDLRAHEYEAQGRGKGGGGVIPLSVSGLCALVNDYDRLYDKAVELRDNLLGRGELSEKKHFVLLDNVMDQLNDEQARVSFEATRLVSYQIMQEATVSLLETSPFDIEGRVPVRKLPTGVSDGGGGAGGMPAWVGTGDWSGLGNRRTRGANPSGERPQGSDEDAQNDGNSTHMFNMPYATTLLDRTTERKTSASPRHVDVMKDACLTITDYFADIQVWLPAYFFAHVVRMCYESLVDLYLVSVLRGRTVFVDPESIAHRMRQEQQKLLLDLARKNGWESSLREAGLKDPALVFGAWEAMERVVLRGGGMNEKETADLLMVLPPPWNVDALLQLRLLRGEDLGDRKAIHEIRQRLTAWYMAELQPQVLGAALAGSGQSARKEGEADAATVGRELAWRLKTSPLAVDEDRLVELVRESVYNQ